jgi:hypothetical protein
MRSLGLVALLAAAAMGCGGGSSTPGGDAGTDASVAPRDAGAVLDATAPDAGTDASVIDGGADAAHTIDASGADAALSDVGPDAESIADANVDAGSACTVSSDCGDPTAFCQYRVGTCGGTGTCTTFGGGCPLFFDPVCGCNGHTYSNAVCATQAGQSIADDTGACTLPTTCGCVHDADCHAGDECVTTRTGGVCKPPPARPMCWRDEDCDAGQTCAGATVCQCGASCIIADRPGTCG